MHELILQYEMDFFRASFCCSSDNMSARLCEDFIEYGTSGVIYNKESVIDGLMKIKGDRNVEISNFNLTFLADDILIVHYTSRYNNISSLRTSIWKNQDCQWKMYFHQGTRTQ